VGYSQGVIAWGDYLDSLSPICGILGVSRRGMSNMQYNLKKTDPRSAPLLVPRLDTEVGQGRPGISVLGG
jgi:hypothetical protein